jgi:hypothetical protein
MPTEAIWSNFNLAGMRANPFSGTLVESDFTHPEGTADEFTDTTGTINRFMGAAGIGELVILSSADNEAAEKQYNAPIVVSGGAPWAFEARVKVTNVTDARAAAFLGLYKRAAALTGDVIADDGAALTDGDALGFCRFAADGDVFDFIYDEGSQTPNVHDDDYAIPVADTYLTLGMYYNGATIQGYLNGVATGTAISAADIAAADFPTAAIMVPTFAVKGDHADDWALTLDWFRAAQPAA